MPNFDQTGPKGQGKMTGRGMGRCGDKNTQGQSAGRGQGRGNGLGRGQGRGVGLGKKMG